MKSLQTRYAKGIDNLTELHLSELDIVDTYKSLRYVFSLALMAEDLSDQNHGFAISNVFDLLNCLETIVNPIFD